MTDKPFIFGLHSIEALLKAQPERVLQLYVQKERRDKKIETLIQLASECDIHIDQVPKQTLDEMTQAANHQGMVAVCKKIRTYSENDLSILLESLTMPPFLLVLDGVEDPHNLGACFRSADAAGVHAIIAPKDKAASITPIVSKVASGAVETVPFVQVTNVVRTMELLKERGIWLYGADGDAPKSLFQTDLSGPVAIVMGAEGVGLRRLTREHCDGLIHIPMQGTVASLNVSVATGICLFEVVRQRQLG